MGLQTYSNSHELAEGLSWVTSEIISYTCPPYVGSLPWPVCLDLDFETEQIRMTMHRAQEVHVHHCGHIFLLNF